MAREAHVVLKGLSSQTARHFLNKNGCRWAGDNAFSTATITIDHYCALHTDTNNVIGCPNIMMVCLANGYQEDTSRLQRHRIYNLVLDQEDTAINWGWVDRDQYTAGFELAVNDNEVLVSFPQTTAHGTSNPSYEAFPREDGFYNLQLPTIPERVVVLFYLHKYMEEENHGRDLVQIENSSRGRVKEDRKNEGKRIDIDRTKGEDGQEAKRAK